MIVPHDALRVPPRMMPPIQGGDPIGPPMAGGGSDPVANPRFHPNFQNHLMARFGTTKPLAPVNQGYFSTTGSLAKLGQRSQQAYNSIPAYQHYMTALRRSSANAPQMATSQQAALPGHPGGGEGPGLFGGSIEPGALPEPPVSGAGYPYFDPGFNPVGSEGGSPNPVVQPGNQTPPSDTPPGMGVDPVTGQPVATPVSQPGGGSHGFSPRGTAGGFVGHNNSTGYGVGGAYGSFGWQPGGGWNESGFSPGAPGNMAPLYFGQGGQAGRTMSASAIW